LFSRKNRSAFPIDEIPITDKLRLGSTQATVDLNDDLVAGAYTNQNTKS